jgi:hypothetical protein
MQYALLIYEDEAVYGSDDSPVMQRIIGEHMQFGQQVGPAIVGGAGLKGTSAATTVRGANGSQTVHDGPFAETKEQLGGFYLIDVPDLDEAIAVAKKIPLAASGSIEIRPLLPMPDAPAGS